jgi:hypothetical protein
MQLNLLGSLNQIDKTKKMMKTYKEIDYTNKYEQQDSIFVDYHGMC